MYDIIYVPKTACVAANNFLVDNYGEYFCHADLINKHKTTQWAHSAKASDVANPIITIREPLSRITALYNYYMNGSDKWADKDKVSISIKDFLSTECKRKGYFWDAHFRPQSWYLRPEDYSKSIVMIYNHDMSITVSKLLEYLKIPVTTDPIKQIARTNKTTYTVKSICDSDQELIKQKYSEDFELYKNLLTNAGKFKKVIEV